MLTTSHTHPMFVHFSIALTILGVILEGINLYKPNKKFPYSCGVLLLHIATISAVIAVITGSLFTPKFVNPNLEHIKAIHGVCAVITVMTLCVTSTMYLIASFLGRYPSKFTWYTLEIKEAGFAFYVLSVLLEFLTGYLGGLLACNRLLEI